jgi:hypothetical protein
VPIAASRIAFSKHPQAKRANYFLASTADTQAGKASFLRQIQF